MKSWVKKEVLSIDCKGKAHKGGARVIQAPAPFGTSHRSGICANRQALVQSQTAEGRPSVVAVTSGNQGTRPFSQPKGARALQHHAPPRFGRVHYKKVIAPHHKTLHPAHTPVSTNSNGDVPGMAPNGMRMGAPALTSRGFKEAGLEKEPRLYAWMYLGNGEKGNAKAGGGEGVGLEL